MNANGMDAADGGCEVVVANENGGWTFGIVRRKAGDGRTESYAFRCEHYPNALVTGMDGGRIASLLVRDPTGRDIISFSDGAWTLEPRGYVQKEVLRAIYSKFN